MDRPEDREPRETADPESTVRISRVFPVARERVFRAWTDPAAITQWWVPMEGYSAPNVEVDLRVGGTYRIAVRSELGGDTHVVGTYREVRVPEKLVYTWRWEGWDRFGETLVTVEFRDLGDSTELILTHALLPDEEAREWHRFGWGAVIDKLGRLLERDRREDV